MKHTTRMVRKRLLPLAALLLSAPVVAGNGWSIDWWTMDGGGEIFTGGGSWTLSGSVGQWDATQANAQTGGSWSLTGGFWSLETSGGDTLFSDGFES